MNRESEEAERMSGDGYSDSGVIGQALVGAARLYPVPPASIAALLVAGAALALVDATRSTPRLETGRAAGRRRAAAVARGLVIATPLVAVFGALFMSADAVFAELVANVLRFDFERIAGHILLFSILAWLSTGYLRGFLTATELPPPRVPWRDDALVALA